MSLSDKFELFVLYFENKIIKYNSNNWDSFKGQWLYLKSRILECILDELKHEYYNKNCAYSDICLYQSHIFNNINSKIDEYTKKSLEMQILYLPMVRKSSNSIWIY